MEAPAPPRRGKRKAKGPEPMTPMSLAGSGIDKAICHICKDDLTAPVTVDCGHNFCRTCITEHCKRVKSPSCPQCRKKFQKRPLKSNVQLGSLIQFIKQQVLNPGKRRREDRNVCEEHGKELVWVYEKDAKCLCEDCTEGRAHCSHAVVPVEEASHEFKKQLEAEKQKTVSEFQQLHQLLKKQEQLLLAHLEELNKKIEKRKDEYIAKHSEEISSFSDLISEMEKFQLPVIEFLQDIKGILSRCEREKFQNPVAFSSELTWTIGELSQNSRVLETGVKKLKESLRRELQPAKESVPLDPDTASLLLILSEDGKSVRVGHKWPNLPDKPERFPTLPCVLGREGFTSGRHCWEVEVGDGCYWAVGVARESVRRKGWIDLCSEGGIWAVLQMGVDQFWALTSPWRPLPLSQVPRKIRVCLDCDQGQVTFSNADDEAPIFTFPPGSVSGERIYLWLCVGP